MPQQVAKYMATRLRITETDQSTFSRSPESGCAEQSSAGVARQMFPPAIAWLFLCGIWSATWLFLRLGVRDFPPLTFAWLRGVLAALVLGVIVGVRRPTFPRELRDWGLMATTGLMAFAMNYALLSWAEQFISSGLGALLSSTVPLFGLMIAHHHVPAERLTFIKGFGVLMGIAGVGLIFSSQLMAKGSMAMWGCLAVLSASFTIAYSQVLVKSRGAHLDRGLLTTVQMCFACVPLLIAGLVVDGNPLRFRWTVLTVVSLSYLALVGSVLGSLIFYWLVKKIAVTQTQLVFLMTPLGAVLLGMLVLDERLSWRIAAGGAAVLGGVSLIVTRNLRTMLAGRERRTATKKG